MAYIYVVGGSLAHGDTYGYSFGGELYHFGKKGQKWGRRQYQNEDGSLTPLGRIHYGIGEARTGVGQRLLGSGETTHKKATLGSLIKRDLKQQRDGAKQTAVAARLTAELLRDSLGMGKTRLEHDANRFAQMKLSDLGTQMKNFQGKVSSKYGEARGIASDFGQGAKFMAQMGSLYGATKLSEFGGKVGSSASRYGGLAKSLGKAAYYNYTNAGRGEIANRLQNASGRTAYRNAKRNASNLIRMASENARKYANSTYAGENIRSIKSRFKKGRR